MMEVIIDLEEVVVVVYQGWVELFNEMVMFSVCFIFIEEMNCLMVSFNDFVFITVNYFGVVNIGNGSNDIIVCGNLFKYMQWCLEGVFIVNFNYFVDQNNVLGFISVLNINLLVIFDFYMVVFLVEYGNIFFGVYDIWLCNGNN